ncbi:MAG: hypothetical protein WC506_02280 [Candidatus Micrarchaeia archaeon]
MSLAGDAIEKHWLATCRLVLGAEIGPVRDYVPWVSQWADHIYYSKSSVSGRQVAFGVPDYPIGSKAISFDEVDFSREYPAVSVDDMKDIDSLFRAVSDRAYYAGNIVLGNSAHVEESANVSDSFYVCGSSRIGDSKYVAYSDMARECESVFGSVAPGESKYLIRCSDTYRAQRCLEGWMVASTTDTFYSFDLNYCAHCMFCFNLRNAKYRIGNVQLERSKYMQVREGLLEQMRAELESKKRLPSLLELLGKDRPDYAPARKALAGFIAPPAPKEDLAPMEAAFTKTAKLVLGAGLSGLSGYSGWLSRHLKLGKTVRSVFSQRPVFQGDYARYFEVPEDRVVQEGEALALASALEPSMPVEKATLANAGRLMRDISYMSLEIRDGANENIVKCMAYADSSNCYSCVPCVHAKNSAYNFWLRGSEHAFGCRVLFDSSFCIHCYQSVKLTRCFEVDSSRGCSDCYFCHNCENVHDSMFCFNAKNLKYAIGNVEMPREKYMAVKKKLLLQAGQQLKSTKTLDYGIYSAGAMA